MHEAPIKIAFVSHTSNIQGAEKMLLNMAKRLDDDGKVEAYVFADTRGKMQQVAEQMGLHFQPLGDTLPWYIFVKDDAKSISTHFRQAVKSADELAGQLTNLGIECVVVNTLSKLPGILAAAKLRLPSVLWLCGILDHTMLPEAGEGFKSACDRLMLYSADAVVCISHWLREYYKFFREDAQAIPNFTLVPEKPADYPSGSIPRFICLNAWQRNKGLECLIEAAGLLHDKNLDFRLDLYGEGPLKDTLNKMVKQRQLEKLVGLHGRVIDTDSLLTDSNALVSASMLEGFGMTLIEAMSHARPLIVSRVLGHEEIVGEDGKYGFLCERQNPASFANKMEWVMRHSGESRKMGIAGYEAAKLRYDGRESSNAMFDVIKKVINQHRQCDPSRQLHRYFLCDIFQDILKPFASITTQDAPEIPGSALITNPMPVRGNIIVRGMEYARMHGVKRLCIDGARYLIQKPTIYPIYLRLSPLFDLILRRNRHAG